MSESNPIVWYEGRPDLTPVKFSGADVLSFLQSKLAADTRRWRRDGGGYAVATDINGKVLFDGEFALQGDEVLALIPSVLVESAVAHLEGYVIMEDVVISRLPGLRVASAEGSAVMSALGFEGAALANLEGVASAKVSFEGAEVEVLAFRAQGATEGGEMWMLVYPAAVEAAVGARARELAPLGEDLQTREIKRGVPRIGRDFMVGETIAIEAGLWRGMSLNKGCYLGQEVLERLFSRGTPARRLVRFSAKGVVAAGDTLTLAGSDAGRVTSVAASEGGVVGMAILRRKALAEGAEIVTESGVALQIGEFVGGPTPEAP